MKISRSSSRAATIESTVASASDHPPAIDPLPRHVAVIMDGNGRWAQQRGLSRQAGHRAGTENIRRNIERFAEHGVGFLTLYAFSTENWTRPKREVNGLIRLLGRVLDRELAQLHKNGIRLLHLGELDVLPEQLQRRVVDAIKLTRDNTGMTVSLAFNYGGRAEIVQAVRRIVADGLPADAIDEATIASYLYTNGVPDPDLIIRTGGDMRLSNFLLWQAAYAEFYSTPTYWPDFGRDDIDQALQTFAARERRFGSVPGINGDTTPATPSP
ncbi:MAG: polyprenyl diphosphate synthase [Dehalococcoidia bacterium]